MIVKRDSWLPTILCSVLVLSCSINLDTEELIPDYTAYSKDSGTDYLEIMVYGDAGTGGKGGKATAAALSSYASDNDIDFIINLGDNFYNEGVKSVDDHQWDSKFESIYDPAVLNMPFYSILGNHDYNGNIQAEIDYVSPNNDRWQMPDRYYKVSRTLDDGTLVDFFFLDTERIYSGEAEQLAWLDSGLASSQADWKVVSGHKPLYSNGKHGSNATLIMRLKGILDNRADLYLAGHEHDMQILDKKNGVYYIVDGSAARAGDTDIGENTIFAASRMGFMTLLFSQNELVCQVIETGAGLIYSKVLKTK